MTSTARTDRHGQRWRAAGWTAAALLLLTPWVAMRFTDEVAWTAGDFAFMAILLLAVGLPLEFTARRTRNPAYRAAVGAALAGAFVLVWINAAVGIIGSEHNDANLLYLGVLAVGLGGALIARFRPPGMARAMTAMALAQVFVGVAALIAGWGGAETGPLELLGLTGCFAAVWLASAWLFRKAAGGDTRERSEG